MAADLEAQSEPTTSNKSRGRDERELYEHRLQGARPGGTQCLAPQHEATAPYVGVLLRVATPRSPGDLFARGAERAAVRQVGRENDEREHGEDDDNQREERRGARPS